MSINAPTPMPVPPWMAMVQAHADRAEADLEARALARDITNGAYEDVIGRRPARHRKEVQS